MAVVRVQPGAIKPAKIAVRSVERTSLKVQKLGLSLPEKPHVPSQVLSEFTILCFGEKKIGKTSLFASFGNSFFLMFEPGDKSLRVRSRPCNKWLEFVGYLDLLEANPDYCDTIIVDPVDIAYERCFEHMCQHLGIVHPHDEDDYGKSWSLIKDEFKRQMRRLMALGKGVVFLSHAEMTEKKDRKGKGIGQYHSTMQKAAANFCEGIVDIWCYYCYDGSDRVLVIRGDETVSAGTRLEDRFLTVDGRPVRVIPMGTSAAEAHRNFLRAWNNELTEVEPGAGAGAAVKTTFAKVGKVTKKGATKR